MTDKIMMERLELAVKTHDQALLEEAFREAEQGGLGKDPVLKALTAGLDAVRERLGHHTASIPEFLLAVDVLKQGIRRLDGLKSRKNTAANQKTIVIGVVEGDVHDLGKNIVADVLAAYGYKILDLGRDVPCAHFIGEAVRSHASMLALSCMMSTPLENMREIIARSRKDLPEAAVLVGGAALDERIAARVGADGYAASAVTVSEEVKRLLAGRR